MNRDIISTPFFDPESAGYHISHTFPVNELRDLVAAIPNNYIVPKKCAVVIDYFPNSDYLYICTDYMFRAARLKVEDWNIVEQRLLSVILWSLKYAHFRDNHSKDSLTQMIFDLFSCQQG